MHEAEIKKLMGRIRNKKISVDNAIKKLKFLPFEDLGFARIDFADGVAILWLSQDDLGFDHRSVADCNAAADDRGWHDPHVVADLDDLGLASLIVGEKNDIIVKYHIFPEDKQALSLQFSDVHVCLLLLVM